MLTLYYFVLITTVEGRCTYLSPLYRLGNLKIGSVKITQARNGGAGTQVEDQFLPHFADEKPEA